MNRDRAGLSSGSDAFLPTNTAGGGGLQRTITWKDDPQHQRVRWGAVKCGGFTLTRQRGYPY